MQTGEIPGPTKTYEYHGYGGPGCHQRLTLVPASYVRSCCFPACLRTLLWFFCREAQDLHEPGAIGSVENRLLLLGHAIENGCVVGLGSIVEVLEVERPLI